MPSQAKELSQELYLARLPASLDTIKERVRQILINVPSSRSSDKILIVEYLKLYSNAFCYDQATRKIAFINHEGISYEQFLKITNFESISRLRRFIQKDALDRVKAGIATEADVLVLPSDKVATQRVLREEEERLYYAR